MRYTQIYFLEFDRGGGDFGGRGGFQGGRGGGGDHTPQGKKTKFE